MNDAHYTAEEVRAHVEAIKSAHLNYVDAGLNETTNLVQAFAARLEADEKAEPVYCTPVEHDGDVAYLHTDQPIPNSDYFLLFTRPAPASSERLAEALRTLERVKNLGREWKRSASETWRTAAFKLGRVLAAHATAKPAAEPVKAGAEIPSQKWMMRVARSWREADESDELSGEDQMLDRVCYVIRSAMRDAQPPAASVAPGTVCIGIDTALLMIETCDFSALKDVFAARQESKEATAGDND